MGGILSSGIGLASIACQSAICCCNVANCCMTAANGADGISARAAKVFYVVLLGICTVIALILRYNGDDFGIDLPGWNIHCSDRGDEKDIGFSVGGMKSGASETYVYCKGDAAVYRISFVLAVFFGIMSFMTVSSSKFHRGFWGIKLGGLFFSLLLCFFIPNSFFDNSGYAWIARIVSILFLCFQILILVDFGYDVNDMLVARAFPDDGSENKEWLVLILVSASLMYLVSLVGIPLIITFYGECGEGVAFSSIILLGIVGFTALTLFRDQIVGLEGAILPAAVVAAYCTFLLWSALDSNPDAECKPGDMVSGNNTTNIVISIAIASISLMYTSVSVSDGISQLVTGEDSGAGSSSEPNAMTPLYSVEGADGNETRAERQSFETAGDEDKDSSNIWIFHLVMSAGSMYMAMVVSNWGAEENAHGNESGKIGFATMIIKFLSAVLCMGLYTWTLVAPAVLQGREFDF